MLEPSDFFITDNDKTYEVVMTEAQAKLMRAIQESGLTEDEVHAMVDNASQFMNEHTLGRTKVGGGSMLPDDISVKAKLPYEPWEEQFIEAFREMQRHIHQVNQSNGWHGPDGTEERDENDMLMHLVSEVAEIYNGNHEGNPPSDKLPGMDKNTEESADVHILGMSRSYSKGQNLAEAIVMKVRYNMIRPYKHGKHF